MRCDLHVHSSHSGPLDTPVAGGLEQHRYYFTLQLFEGARAPGMNLVMITDHDIISCAVLIADRPGVVVGEEETVALGDGPIIYFSVWGIDERVNEIIQRLR